MHVACCQHMRHDKYRLTICVDVDVSCDLEVMWWPDDDTIDVGPIVKRWLDPEHVEVTTLGVFLLDWALFAGVGPDEAWPSLCAKLAEDARYLVEEW